MPTEPLSGIEGPSKIPGEVFKGSQNYPGW